jgi:heptosyltransferase-1
MVFKVLIVKISSMGDLIQCLPAITDAKLQNPNISFDWLIDKNFAEVASWHPAIKQVIVSNHRAWKKDLKKFFINSEFRSFIKKLRATKYDLVIDAQSNLKSSIFTILSRGKKFGLDAQSVHEYGAHFAYHKRIKISKYQHHITRVRKIFAQALDYKLPKAKANYGIQNYDFPAPNIKLPEKFFFFAPNASRTNKLWPSYRWQQLIKLLNSNYPDYKILIPWQSEKELSNITEMIATTKNTLLLPPCSISEKAYVIQRATTVISTDTGLAHLAAALDRPNVTLYGPTLPKLCATIGRNQIHITANSPLCAPCLRKRCSLQDRKDDNAACMDSITSGQIYAEICKLVPVELADTLILA